MNAITSSDHLGKLSGYVPNFWYVAAWYIASTEGRPVQDQHVREQGGAR